jgi:hypothetical protein
MTRGVYAPNAMTLFNAAVNGFENFTAASTSSNPVDLSEVTDILLTVTIPAGALTGTTPTSRCNSTASTQPGTRSRQW